MYQQRGLWHHFSKRYTCRDRQAHNEGKWLPYSLSEYWQSFPNSKVQLLLPQAELIHWRTLQPPDSAWNNPITQLDSNQIRESLPPRLGKQSQTEAAHGGTDVKGRVTLQAGADSGPRTDCGLEQLDWRLPMAQGDASCRYTARGHSQSVSRTLKNSKGREVKL